MRRDQNKRFGSVRSRVDEICERYRICKMKLDNLNNQILNPEMDAERIAHYRNYINTIELILKCLDPEDAALIRNIGFHKVPTAELGYSATTYYSHYRKAATTFLKYLTA
ncbi:MAG: hypothetical protein LBS76_02715 [Mycoplasmataceae bacterium]|jgi:hypothetical protein|nr:hypothetical protein [Mycoplasmataceae bacterium]